MYKYSSNLPNVIILKYEIVYSKVTIPYKQVPRYELAKPEVVH